MFREMKVVGGLVAGLTVAGTAHPAPLPDAGQILQQMERDILPAPAPRDLLPPAPLPAPMQDMRGPTMVVRAFRFSGNVRFSEAELSAAVAGYLNRPLTFAELQMATAAAAEIYRKAGWVVRAYLPEQDVVGGVVTIRIVEAIFGGSRLEGPPPARINPDRIKATIDRAMPEGEAANTDQLDRALLLLGDLPGLAVQGTLRQGRNERETELAVRSQSRPLYTGTAAVDNFGAESTGVLRGTGNLFLNSLFGLGDQTVISAIGSRGNQYGRLAWSLPVGYGGWRVGVSASYLKYRLVSSGFSGLNALGSSATQGISASWPMIRSRAGNFYWTFNYDHRSFDNRALHDTVSKYNVNAVSVTASGNLFDEFAGLKGINTATLSLGAGVVGPGHPEFSDAPSNTRFRYGKLRYTLSREQQISDDFSAFVAFTGQMANRNLDSSEKFYLGGPDGVRAYATDKAGGSRGQMANVELRWKLPENVTAAAFYDWGHLDISHGLSSAGLSVAWQAEFGLIARAAWANSIGKDPDNIDGGDPSTARPRNRFWLSATQPF